MHTADEYRAGTISERTLRAYCSAAAAMHYQDIVGAPFVHLQPEDCKLSDQEKRKRSLALWERAQAQGIVL